MANEADQMTRAGNYVLGLMEGRERERAEHDLEIDPSFRDAVMRVAERMHMFDAAGATKAAAEDDWEAVAERIAELPQMRGKLAVADMTESEVEAGRAGLIAPSPVARKNGRPDGRRAVLAGAAIAVAMLAAAAAGYLLSPRAGAAQPAFVAVLQAPDGTPGAVLEIGADDALRLVVTDVLATTTERSIELWTVAPGSDTPAQVGRIDRTGSLVLAGSPSPVQAGQLYRLVAEPAPGVSGPGDVLAEGAARPVSGR